MSAVFSKVLDMSMTASFVILAVLAARWFLRKSPKVISYALWAVVLFRLLCPVSLTAPISLLEATQPKVTVHPAGTSQVSYLQDRFEMEEFSGEIIVAQVRNPAEEIPAAPEDNRQTAWNWMAMASWIWLAGAGVMAVHSLASYQKLRRCLTKASRIEAGVLLADGIPTPFVMGLLKPKIYLPSDTPMEERGYILAHERHHIQRGDHVIKLLAYAALCVHWFNPLVWLAFFEANKDMEMSCDEAVIHRLGSQIRADYAQTLINMASNRSIIGGMPLAFGEGDTKSRVKNMVKWQKPKTWVVFVSILVSVLVLVSCAVNPVENKPAGEAAQQTDPIEVTEEIMPESVSIGMKIPSDLELVPLANEIQFCPVNMETREVSETPWGGVKTYPAPENPLVMPRMDSWLRDLGVPQIMDGLHDYMAGSSLHGDMEASFADAGGRETKHYYYAKGEKVFELWFETRFLDDMTRAAILESVSFAADARIEKGLPMVQTEFYGDLAEDARQIEEEFYLEKCRDVLQSLQGEENISIKIQRSNYGGPVINDTSTAWYYRNGSDWLLMYSIPVDGILDGVPAWENKWGYMQVDGVRYDNGENPALDENRQVHWGRAKGEDAVSVWFSSFRWDAQDVLFVSQMAAGKGMCITMQVMAAYYGNVEGEYPHYQMQFFFDENGAFRRVENTIFFHDEAEGDYSSKEILQVTGDSAEEIIQYEYQRYLDMQ